MDTHIAPPLTILSDDAALSARLPGETVNPVQGDPPTTTQAAAEPVIQPPVRVPGKRSRRGKLLAGTAAAVLVAGAGAGVFLISSYNTVYPVPGLASSVRKVASDVGVPLPPILAPSAPLAKVVVPYRPPVFREAHETKPREQQIAEISSLHAAAKTASVSRPSRSPEQAAVPGAPPPPKQAAVAQPVPAAPVDAHAEPSGSPAAHDPQPALGDAPHEPGANFPVQVPTRQSAAAAADRPQDTPPVAFHVLSRAEPSPSPAAPQDATAAILAAMPPATRPAPPVVAQPAAPSVTPPAAVEAPLRTPAPQRADAAPAPAAPVVAAVLMVADAVATAQKLHAGPMTSSDEIQVLNMVTEMARIVKDLRTQNAQLRADFGKSAADTAAHLADYERRLAMAEGARAVLAAGEAPNVPLSSGPAQPLADAQPPQTRGMLVAMARSVAVDPASAGTAKPKAYKVQAASPGLAMLAEVDRGGGEGAQRQVVVGETIPEYGRVTSISQKGTAWVVMTEHGPIQ